MVKNKKGKGKNIKNKDFIKNLLHFSFL